jgi:Zn finger protein HypA/HybF involved in hydrogenase expression
MSLDEATFIRCSDCRCEYQPGHGGTIACPKCGGAAWIAAEIAAAPELNVAGNADR